MLNIDGLVVGTKKQSSRSNTLYILTAEHGVITATCRTSGKLTSKNLGGTQLFAYSSFSLELSKGWYYVRSALPLHIFWYIRGDLKKLGLASYFMQLVIECRNDKKNDEILQLTLNTLYFLETSKGQSQRLLKSVFELRFLALNGYMPNVLACERCGKYLPDSVVFMLKRGCFYCREHLPEIRYPSMEDEYFPVSHTCLHAIRFIVLSEPKKIFMFKLSDRAEAELSRFCEKFLLWQLSGRFSALDFYKSILNNSLDGGNNN